MECREACLTFWIVGGQSDEFPRAAGYINRILKGEKAADLPLQAPTKYQWVVNLPAPKAIGNSATIAASNRRRGDRIAAAISAVHNVASWPISAAPVA
jgi:hypothetical protein